MTRESTYIANLRSLRLVNFREYLYAHGWKRSNLDYRGALAIFNKEGSDEQVLVPMKPQYEDFVEQMGNAVAKLARTESRSERSVLQDILAGSTDTLRYRVVSAATARGTLPLEHGIALLEGARRSLLAAACSVLSPEKAYHPRMSFTPAEEFVEACELGQTEEGSFAVVLKCPLHFAEGSADVHELPFARRATDTLYSSVSLLVNAIEQDRIDSLLHDKSPSDTLITANLCDALMKMQPDAELGSVDLTVSWAPALPHNSAPSQTVRLRSEMFPRIADVGKMLRGPAAAKAAFFLARVDVLSGSDIDDYGQRYGEVRLSVVLGEDDEVVRARVLLNAAQYKVADEAHMKNRYVIINAVLNRSGKTSRLSDVSSFELADKQLRVFPGT